MGRFQGEDEPNSKERTNQMKIHLNTKEGKKNIWDMT
jgi:hypothetical protein